MIKIQEAIVVEGRYDKNTLSQVVDAPIIETSGFGIMNDKAQLAFLRQVAQKRGLIIFTDSDGAGFVIRNYLKGALPKEHIKQAYIPDICGKERRKSKAGKEGLLGVEGMNADILRTVLIKAGVGVDGSSVQKGFLTKADMFAMGLSGGTNSAANRSKLVKALELPERLSPNALLEVLNALYSKEEVLHIWEIIQ